MEATRYDVVGAVGRGGGRSSVISLVRGSAQRRSVKSPGRDAGIQVLVALEDDYRSYREAIAYAIRKLRPHAAVVVTGLDALEAEAARVVPDLVICSRPAVRDLRGTPVWIELPIDAGLPAQIHLDGRRPEPVELTLDRLISVVDRTEMLIRSR